MRKSGNFRNRGRTPGSRLPTYQPISIYVQTRSFPGRRRQPRLGWVRAQDGTTLVIRYLRNRLLTECHRTLVAWVQRLGYLLDLIGQRGLAEALAGFVTEHAATRGGPMETDASAHSAMRAVRFMGVCSRR